MNDKNYSVILEQVHDLKHSSRVRTAPGQPLVILSSLGIRTLGTAHDLFSFRRDDSMLPDVLDIPIVPSKLHTPFLN